MSRVQVLYRNAALLHCAALAFASLWMIGFFVQGWQKKLSYFREIGGVYTQADRDYISVVSARVADSTYFFAFATCGLATLLCGLCAWAVLKRRRWTGWLLWTLWLGSVAGMVLSYNVLRVTEGVYWRRSPFMSQFYIAAVPLELAAVILLLAALGYALFGRPRLKRSQSSI